ncbi:MAG: hypothetical protein JWO77_3670 [Ilumatobacteraceae bacterium]|nr:hypothetical protein [Ilumatobacteraceae bacterium]
MRHARFDVATLALEGIPLVLKAAYLLVAEQDGLDDLQWECLAYAVDPAPLRRDTYAVDIVTLDGRELAGRAALVRSVEGAHVLRGDGPLAGFSDADLR